MFPVVCGSLCQDLLGADDRSDDRNSEKSIADDRLPSSFPLEKWSRISSLKNVFVSERLARSRGRDSEEVRKKFEKKLERNF